MRIIICLKLTKMIGVKTVSKGFRIIKLEVSPEERAKAEERGVFITSTGHTGSYRSDFIYRLVFNEEDHK